MFNVDVGELPTNIREGGLLGDYAELLHSHLGQVCTHYWIKRTAENGFFEASSSTFLQFLY